MSEHAFAVVGHFVATDGDWPDNLGQLDEKVAVKLYESRDKAERALMWYPDGYVVEATRLEETNVSFYDLPADVQSALLRTPRPVLDGGPDPKKRSFEVAYDEWWHSYVEPLLPMAAARDVNS